MSSTPPALIARYGADAAPAEADLTPLIEQLLAHRSVRAYLPDPVSDAQLAAIIAAAQSAASSSNLNVWSVVAVRDAGKRARLAELAGNQAHVRDAPLQLVWLADLARLRAMASAAERPADGLDYLEMFLVGAIDAAGPVVQVRIQREGVGRTQVAPQRALAAAAVVVVQAVLQEVLRHG